MPRKIVLFIMITVSFVLQTTLFQFLSIANIVPNLMIILVSSFGFMRGRKEGMYIGLCSGLLIDIFCGSYIGVYALLYMCIGYINGFFRKRFYPEDVKLPLLLIAGSDVAINFMVYFFMFFFRKRLNFIYYLKAIILPELVYTMLITIFLYFILLMINQKLEAYEKRRAIKFDL